MVLSSAHLLKQLLNKSFGFSPDDKRNAETWHSFTETNCTMQQKWNFKIHFKNGILYKKSKQEGIFLLCLPHQITTSVVFNLHNAFGFHFKTQHLQDQLECLIYFKAIKQITENVIRTCPICIISKPKQLKNFVVLWDQIFIYQEKHWKLIVCTCPVTDIEILRHLSW